MDRRSASDNRDHRAHNGAEELCGRFSPTDFCADHQDQIIRQLRKPSQDRPQPAVEIRCNSQSQFAPAQFGEDGGGIRRDPPGCRPGEVIPKSSKARLAVADIRAEQLISASAE